MASATHRNVVARTDVKMLYMDILTPPDKVETKELKELPTLEELQKAVGGLIESVPYFDKYKKHDCTVFCNEEGKLLGLELNHSATMHWCFGTPQILGVDYLVGPIAIVYGDRELLDKL